MLSLNRYLIKWTIEYFYRDNFTSSPVLKVDTIWYLVSSAVGQLRLGNSLIQYFIQLDIKYCPKVLKVLLIKALFSLNRLCRSILI